MVTIPLSIASTSTLSHSATPPPRTLPLPAPPRPTPPPRHAALLPRTAPPHFKLPHSLPRPAPTSPPSLFFTTPHFLFLLANITLSQPRSVLPCGSLITCYRDLGATGVEVY
ncbi:hypothetical protein E2C01_091007 [Portunus trituberculatus]|uniref:Uncharacterized protein n=1 Tax=Portunus trituberculatus TaxID=210409 RepID=A0A5B7JCV6_PORTR|nr:hypothetical protein [Portunus trituberculatus]